MHSTHRVVFKKLNTLIEKKDILDPSKKYSDTLSNNLNICIDAANRTRLEITCSPSHPALLNPILEIEHVVEK